MFKIGKSFKFDAAHRLGYLPADHQCSRLHGHTYNVTLTLISRNRLEDEGWVYDYGKLKPFKDWINRNLDHRFLNDVIGELSTAERLAQYLFSLAEELFSADLPVGVRIYSVRVQETADTFAEYSLEN
jgi:6-pyruvoyltetrahydropterin/6-carboxytetrahydropterin synthase